MSSKKKTPATLSTSPQTLKIGSRVRCTDDGVEGRIVWANAVAVKIRWDDGEQVTWRRDSLADRPIEILDAIGGEDQHAATAVPEQTDGTPPPQAEQEVAPMTEPSSLPTEPPAPELPVASATTDLVPADPITESVPAEPMEMPAAVTLEQPPAAGRLAEQPPPLESAQETQKQVEQTAEQPQTPSVEAKPPRMRKPKKAADDGQAKKLSALDAAAKVLGETGQPMSCQELIEAMATKGYWTSPGGKTPAATLYSAIAREITTKGTSSRFQKAERGKFARNGAA
ncbi:MAG TPA: HTH domain-containing protein [Gemmataceae bacterium]|nr:HTH domain-containing protein [Gemmataceae bacterium]